MAKEILVRHGIKTKLAQDCGCSRSTVIMALKGLDDTDLLRLVRQRAKEFYGGK